MFCELSDYGNPLGAAVPKIMVLESIVKHVHGILWQLCIVVLEISLVKSHQNGVSRNMGRFTRDIILLFSVPSYNISRTSYHVRQRAAEFRGKHRCYDCAKKLRLNQHTRTNILPTKIIWVRFPGVLPLRWRSLPLEA